ncbi:MAG TPA: glycosyl transferase family 1, partial [Rudaea sp.]
IASSARAFAEEVGHGNGVVFREGDVGALAAAITRLLDEPFLAADWAAQAQRLSRQRTWPVIARRFREMFETLTEAKAHAA